MKTADNSLFLLIHSLSPNEKGYFKKYFALQTSSVNTNYVQLFDAIAKQKRYDESALKKQLYKGKIIRQFSGTKNYLYNLILQSLEGYKSQGVDGELKRLLSHIQILRQKKLKKSCEKYILKAKRLALQYDSHRFLAEILLEEIVLLETNAFHGKTEQEIEALFNELLESIHKNKNMVEYYSLSTRFFLKADKIGYARTIEETKEYEKISQDPLLQSEKNALSYLAKSRFYSFHASYAHMQFNLSDSYRYYTLLIKYMEANPHQIKESQKRYLVFLQNFILLLQEMKKYHEAFAMIQKLKSIVPFSDSSANFLSYAIVHTELIHYCQTGDVREGEKIIEKTGVLENFMKSLNKTQELKIYTRLAALCFVIGDYPLSNKYLNKIIYEENRDTRTDIQCFVRILSLMLHYEMGKQDLLEYTVASTYRFLLKRNRVYKFENIVLDFIRKKTPEINSRKEQLDAFKLVHKEIEKLEKDPFENKALHFFDVISWLESKIEGRPFAEIVREKAK